jgi:hypothetical protein
VFGNRSEALAGFGDNNIAQVFGNRSKAAAVNGNNQTVNAIGNNVQKPQGVGES